MVGGVLVASLMEQATSLGVRRVSLNFAMFGHIFEAADQVGASAWNRFASRSLGVLDRFLQLRRLYRFNLKFAPLWVPRFWRRSRRWRWRMLCLHRVWQRAFAEFVGAPFAGSGAGSFCR